MTLAACGSGGSPSKTAAAPGARFGTAMVSGLGNVIVDGRGRTVYVLTSDGRHNLACSDASGCTSLWPDIPLPNGTSAATANGAARAGLLGTVHSDGETYATYHGWRVYEYAGDTGAAEAHGQDIKSFGGTWYALSPTGTPVTSTVTSSSNGNGY